MTREPPIEGGQVLVRRALPPSDDGLGDREDLLDLPPRGQAGEVVAPQNHVEHGSLIATLNAGERPERVDREGGTRASNLRVGDLPPRILRGRELEHRKSGTPRRKRLADLVRRRRCRSEDDLIQPELHTGPSGYLEVALVDRVKGPAEQGDSRSGVHSQGLWKGR